MWSKSSAVKVKPFTTFLGTIFPEGHPIYSTDLAKGLSPQKSEENLKLFGRYEAVLTQAAYMSRLVYEPSEVIADATNFVNYNPVAFNTALTIISHTNAKNVQRNLKQALSPKVNYVGHGCLLNSHDTPCYMQLIDYSNTTACPFPGEKVLYIAFRGTITLNSALTDAKIHSRRLSDLLEKCSIQGIGGLQAFQDVMVLLEEERKKSYLSKIAPVNPFGAHSGFVTNMIDIMVGICSTLEKEFLPLGPTRIVVTGHSLGGANSALCSLVLAGFRRHFYANGGQFPQVHCINFGSPKIFTDFARNVYNDLLLQKHLTLDRVANRVYSLLQPGITPGAKADLVPMIPPNFDHAGFSILKLEHSTQSKTGRSKNITELRQMITGGDSGTKFNELPTYKEFLDCFEPILAAEYKELILNIKYGTLSRSVTANAKATSKMLSSVFRRKDRTNEYRLIKSHVEQVLNKQQDELTENNVETVAEVPNPVAEIATAVEGPEIEEATQEQAIEQEQVGGSYTSDYKGHTLTVNPNHIVYHPQYNISGISAHVGYMGVGFWGVIRAAKYHVSTLARPYQLIFEGPKMVGSGRKLTRKRKSRKRKSRKI
jgi:hypothetical protein